MNLQRTMLLGAVLLAAAACSDDSDPVTTEIAPRAGIRYVNAVPDTFPLDFKAVDIVENSPYILTAFREIKQAGYTPAAAGERKFRVFPNNAPNPSIDVVSQILVDTTLSLGAGQNYTVLHVGFARAGQTPKQRLVVRADTLPTVPAGQIAVRIVHAGVNAPAVDVYNTATATAALPATAAYRNVAYLGASPYVFFPTAPALALRLTAAGTTAVLSTVSLPVGEAATTSRDALPGSTIAGSVFTVYVFGRSIAGSKAPQSTAPATVFTNPALSTPVADVQVTARPTS